MKDNKEVVMRYVQKFNEGDLEGLRMLFSVDALVHGVLGWGSLDEVMTIWKELVHALNIRLRVEDIVCEADKVAVRYTEFGHSTAPFFDKPCTGKRYELLAMEWFIIHNGKIHKRWGTRDAASQARQLGWDIPAEKTKLQLGNKIN